MRQIRDIGRRVAFAGIGTAISLVFVVLAFYIKNLSLTFYVLSSIGVMLPLSCEYYREGLLASVAVAVAGFFIVNLSIIPFIGASGFYVVFVVFWHNKKLNKWIGCAIKAVYSCVLFFILFKLTSLISINLSALPKIEALSFWKIYAIFNVIFTLCFIVYDVLLEQGYIYMVKTVKKIL